MADKGKDKAPEMARIKVMLNNGHTTSGGTGPGVVSLPAGEAQVLLDAGYAVRVAS